MPPVALEELQTRGVAEGHDLERGFFGVGIVVCCRPVLRDRVVHEHIQYPPQAHSRMLLLPNPPRRASFLCETAASSVLSNETLPGSLVADSRSIGGAAAALTGGTVSRGVGYAAEENVADKGRIGDADVVVVGGFPHRGRQRLPLRHSRENNRGAPAQTQDRLRQVELLALHSSERMGRAGGSCGFLRDDEKVSILCVKWCAITPIETSARIMRLKTLMSVLHTVRGSCLEICSVHRACRVRRLSMEIQY